MNPRYEGVTSPKEQGQERRGWGGSLLEIRMKDLREGVEEGREEKRRTKKVLCKLSERQKLI